MKILNKLQKSLAQKRKWAFLFLREKINRGTFRTAFHALEKKLCMWNLYTTLFDLPLFAYINISCDKTFNPLKKMPLWTPQWLLANVYEELMKEYAVLSENKEVIFQQARQNQIEALRNKIIHLTLCGQILVAVLNKLIKEEDATEAFEYLKSKNIIAGDTEMLFKKLEITIKNSNFQLNELISQSKTDKKETGEVTRSDFDKIITIANKNGYKADYSMKTASFINMINIQRDEHKELEKLKTKK